MKADLSILIPARNEIYLARTVENILQNIRGNTEILVGLDGEWADPPIKDDPRVTIVYHNESVGQRAMTNDLCKLSKAKYVMKIDAHCAVDEGFDVKMMEEMQDDYTMIPALYNLHAFNWECKKCGNVWYQSPTPKHCQLPGEERKDNPDCDNTTDFKKVMVWDRRKSRRSECYRFDHTMHFQYHREQMRKNPEDTLIDTMSAQGSCFMLTRDKYWELNICGEDFGSWGTQGTEVACKTWLSGGRLVTNRKTWYAHMFRTQGGDFGFPYMLDNKQVEHSRKHGRDIFMNDKWGGQIRPLYWLVDKFKPLSDWHGEEGSGALRQIMESAVTFTGVDSIANLTSSAPATWLSRGKKMTSNTVSSSGLLSTGRVASKDIDPVGSKSEMHGIATEPITTNVVNYRNVPAKVSSKGTNKPGIHNSMDSNLGSVKSNSAIPKVIGVSSPVPAPSGICERDFGKNTLDGLGVELVDGKPFHKPHFTHLQSRKSTPTKGIIYYTDNQLNVRVAKAVQRRLEKFNLPIVSASLKPMAFGENIHVKRKRGVLSMFKQILTALVNSKTDIVFFCEHDVLYHPSHFDFTPHDKNKFYYNENVWKIDQSTGKALHYPAKQVSGIAVWRETAIEHYKKRVEMVERDGYSMKMGYEPGTHRRPERVDDLTAEGWMSKFPNVDVRHDNNLSPTRWKKEEFRNQKYTKGWIEGDADTIPGWKREDFKLFLGK